MSLVFVIWNIGLNEKILARFLFNLTWFLVYGDKIMNSYFVANGKGCVHQKIKPQDLN